MFCIFYSLKYIYYCRACVASHMAAGVWYTHAHQYLPLLASTLETWENAMILADIMILANVCFHDLNFFHDLSQCH